LVEAAGETGRLDVPLDAGVPIGGAIRNSEGEAVADAVVEIAVAAPGAELDASGNAAIAAARLQPAVLAQKVKTDPEGRWRYANAPPGLTAVEIQIQAPEESRVTTITYRGAEELNALRNLEAGAEIEKRYVLTGTVRDEEGRPVQGARIAAWPAGESGQAHDVAYSRKDGVFKARDQAGGPVRILVQADDMTPLVMDAEAGPDAPEVEAVLEPGQNLEIEVVDDNGEPLEGTLVQVERWGEIINLDWRAYTDDKGGAVWEGAPEDEVVLSIDRLDYEPVEGLEARAVDSPVRVVLERIRLLQITGTVMDVQSGEPVPWFRVTPGGVRNGETVWMPEAAIEDAGGRYSIVLDDAFDAYVLKFEAEEFQPLVSPEVNVEEEQADVDVELTPKPQS
jgi:protocatechuate 3,4-dioxygenase beta subunit